MKEKVVIQMTIRQWQKLTDYVNVQKEKFKTDIGWGIISQPDFRCQRLEFLFLTPKEFTLLDKVFKEMKLAK